jgi:hypothetical protein
LSICQNHGVSDAFKDWTPEQIAAGWKWVAAWQAAGPELERIRREELRNLDVQNAIAALRGNFDYTAPPVRPSRHPDLWNCNDGS